jgi:hypothetical protein
MVAVHGSKSVPDGGEGEYEEKLRDLQTFLSCALVVQVTKKTVFRTRLSIQSVFHNTHLYNGFRLNGVDVRNGRDFSANLKRIVLICFL